MHIHHLRHFLMIADCGSLTPPRNRASPLLSTLTRAIGYPGVRFCEVRERHLLPMPEVSAIWPARSFGDVWTLTEPWNSLGFAELGRTFRRTRHTIDVEALIRVMVFNRLCDPDSKLGVLRWLRTVALPDVDLEAVTHQQLLCSMDALSGTMAVCKRRGRRLSAAATELIGHIRQAFDELEGKRYGADERRKPRRSSSTNR